MAEVKGQFYLKVDINDKKDIIPRNGLMSFTLIEEANNLLPTFMLQFVTTDSSLVGYWNEGAILDVSWGIGQDDKINSKLVISEKNITPKGDALYVYSAKGMYNAIGFVTIPFTRNFGPYSGVNVANAIASQFFSLDKDNITHSEDTQVWSQVNISNKRFLDEVLKHSYIKNSFIGYGITCDGRYIIRDVRANVKKGHTLTISSNPQNPGDIVLCSAPKNISNANFINSFVGYGRERPIRIAETGEITYHKPDFTTLLSNAKSLVRNKDITRLPLPIVMHNSNLHNNYHVASLNNTLGLALASSEEVTVSYLQNNTKVSIWDVVMLTVDDTLSKTSEELSGLYIVGLVSRTLTHKGLVTTLKLYREAPNKIKGDVR